MKPWEHLKLNVNQLGARELQQSTICVSPPPPPRPACVLLRVVVFSRSVDVFSYFFCLFQCTCLIIISTG